MRKMTNKDYGYCKDCDMYFDIWKDRDIIENDHKGHKWRYVDDKELKECIKDCKRDGCFEEEFI